MSHSLQPHGPQHAASLSFTISQSLLQLTSIESVMPSNHLILCRPLLLPSIFPSIRVFFSESALRIRWPKYWSFSFSISPSSEYSKLISFRMDWLDLLGSFCDIGIGRLSNHDFSSPLPQWNCFTSIRGLLAQLTVSHGLGGHVGGSEDSPCPAFHSVQFLNEGPLWGTFEGSLLHRLEGGGSFHSTLPSGDTEV